MFATLSSLLCCCVNRTNMNLKESNSNNSNDETLILSSGSNSQEKNQISKNDNNKMSFKKDGPVVSIENEKKISKDKAKLKKSIKKLREEERKLEKLKKKKLNNKKNKILKNAKDHISGLFVFDDISKNKEASSLMQDLIKCFTCNSNLPEKELETLNATLYERTISVFLYVLNCFVEKIFKNFLESDYIKVLNFKKIEKKDASCQTEITGDISPAMTKQ